MWMKMTLMRFARGVKLGLIVFSLLQALVLHPRDALSAEGPDLQGEIVGPVRFDRVPGFGDKIIFSIRITNTGMALPLSGVTVKPILIPSANANGAVTDGVVLPSKTYRITLGGGDSVVVNYRGTLPYVRRARYWVVAVIDSKGQIEESNELNNVTNGVDIGREIDQLHVPPLPLRGSPIDIGVTLAEDIVGEGVTPNGVLYSDLTLIVHGNDPIPETQAGRMWARYVLVDLATGQTHTVVTETTDPGDAEEPYFSFLWEPVGRNRFESFVVDGVILRGIPIGRYALVSVMDSHDNFGETNEANNTTSLLVEVRALVP